MEIKISITEEVEYSLPVTLPEGTVTQEQIQQWVDENALDAWVQYGDPIAHFVSVEEREIVGWESVPTTLVAATSLSADVNGAYAYFPHNCPSRHWNDGTDTCSDCGADLNAPAEVWDGFLAPLAEMYSEWAARNNFDREECDAQAIMASGEATPEQYNFLAAFCIVWDEAQAMADADRIEAAQ